MRGYGLNDLAVIFLDSFLEIDCDKQRKIFSHYSKESDIFTMIETVEYYFRENLSQQLYETVKDSLNRKYINDILDDLEKFGITPITFLSDKYPESLKRCSSYPTVLYCKGNLDLLNAEHSFAIVGSRRSLPIATFKAEEISSSLSQHGVVVITGCADGGDTAVLNGALQSGKVISVIASGINNIYPAINKNLVEKVAKVGLVVSEYPPKVKGRPWMNVFRNRIIAGLSQGVLVVSGERTSGTRITAEYALDEGKDVFAIPYSPGIPSGEICNFLIKNGAYLCEDSSDILSVLGITKVKTEEYNLSAEEISVYNAVKNGNNSTEKIMQATGMQIYEVLPIITSLELSKIIIKEKAGTFVTAVILNL